VLNAVITKPKTVTPSSCGNEKVVRARTDDRKELSPTHRSGADLGYMRITRFAPFNCLPGARYYYRRLMI